MDKIYHYQESFLENLAKADNFRYNSTWVFEELNKERYIKYIKGKLEMMRCSRSKFNFCIFDAVGRNEPHLLLTPKTPEGDFGCFIAKANDEGLIEELSLTSARFFHHECKDKEKLKIFMEKAKKE